MALPTTYTDPSTLEQAVGAVVPAAKINAILGNIKLIGGTWPADVSALGNRTASGKVVQYGAVTTGTESTFGTPTVYYASASVTFPAAFADAPFFYSCHLAGDGRVWDSRGSITTTGATVYACCQQSGVVASKNISWLAVGTP